MNTQTQRTQFYTFLFVLILLFGTSCSVNKNTLTSRNFHNLTARFNILFNGNESMKRAEKKMDKQYVDNYSEVLPIFKYGDPKMASKVSGDMDRSLEKAAKLIKLHSITTKPKYKKQRIPFLKRDKSFYNKPEYCKWVDDSYLLMGVANLYKHDFTKSVSALQYIINRFGEEPIVRDAKLWLARVHIEQQMYGDAENELNILNKEKELHKKFKREINLSYAHLYLSQKEYAKAIPYIQRVANKTRNKQRKARYKFILAQLYERAGNNHKAVIAYNEVVRLNPPYDMAFNAKINAILGTNKRLTDAERKLKKLLRDEKNYDYRDRIYYALGLLQLKQKNQNAALEQFLMATSVPESDRNIKALSFLEIARINFEKPNYLTAQAYYDSTMQFLDIRHDMYNDLKIKTDNLSGLVTHLQTIALQDSIQKIATMPERQRSQLINNIIEEVKRAEEAEKITQQQKQRYLPDQDNLNRTKASGSSFYFYNPSNVSIGVSEFKKKWGNRKKEDHWRRSNKTVIEKIIDVTDENTDEQTDKITDNKSPEFYIQHLPLTDSAMVVSHQKIRKAIMGAAETYKNKLEDYPESVNMYELFIERYPKNLEIPSVLYHLYLLNNESGEKTKANKYKQKLTTEHPESNYAKLFTNPNYIKQLQEEAREAERFYQTTYAYFTSASYTQVITNATAAEDKFPKNKLLDKFRFLKIMAEASTDNTETYAEKLRIFADYATDTDLKEQARMMLDVLASKNKAVAATEATLEEEIYTAKIEGEQVFVMSLMRKELGGDEIKFRILSFNIDNFTEKNYNIELIDFDTQIRLITLNGIKTKAEAIAYYHTIVKATSISKGLKDNDFHFFAITKANFVTLSADKDIKKYLRFFTKNYFK